MERPRTPTPAATASPAALPPRRAATSARRRGPVGVLAVVAVGLATLGPAGSPVAVPPAAAAGAACATPSPKARGAGAAAPTVKRLVRRAGTRTSRRPRLASTGGRPPRRLVRDDVVRCRQGAAAKAGDTVRVRYSLAVWGRRRVVESTWGRGGAVSLPLKKGSLIDGWVEGLPGMRVGGRRVLVVPPGKGYGAAGTGDVPKNATLVFVVDLVGID